MIPKRILQKVKRIEIRTKGLVDDLFGGEYHSAFKGQGMTFSEVREYYPGDDIRMIDWNVTARNNAPFIKVFEEERELTVYILVDISSSGGFGTINQLKSDISAELASVLGFSAIKNQDKVGLILFSSKVEKYIPPKKNKSHILRLIREVLFHKPTNNGTSIKTALDFLMNVSTRKSVVFLISDFFDDDYWSALKLANKKHDLIGIRISDPAEKKIPNLGLLKVLDPESKEEYWVDTTSKKDIAISEKLILNKWNNFDIKSKKNKFDLVHVSTSQDYVEPLMSFFQKRERRS